MFAYSVLRNASIFCIEKPCSECICIRGILQMLLGREQVTPQTLGVNGTDPYILDT